MTKYFSPEKEDICLGYECEFHGMTVGGLLIMDLEDESKSTMITEPNIKVWYPIKCGLDPWSNEKTPEEIYKLINNNQIRVKALNKEQIEADDWKAISQPLDPDKLNGFYCFSKGNYLMVWYSEKSMVDIIIKDPSKEERVWNPERFRLFCECKDINTLRKISKLLSV